MENSHLTTDRNDPNLGFGGNETTVPQNKKYLVLSEEERTKGFVRPVRQTYIHVGKQGPKNSLRDLTAQEQIRYEKYGYVKYEEYSENSSNSVVGRYWTRQGLEQLNNGCGTTTTMELAIAETYARDPHFYGYTYCVNCSKHLPVGEFVWEDGSVVGS